MHSMFKSILFVFMGNIFSSPTVYYFFRFCLRELGVTIHTAGVHSDLQHEVWLCIDYYLNDSRARSGFADEA